MTVSQQFLIESMLWIGGATIAVIGALLGLIWRQLHRALDIIHCRLKALAAEDRDIRGQLNQVLLQLLENKQITDEAPASEDELRLENRRLRFVLREYKRRYGQSGSDSDLEDTG